MRADLLPGSTFPDFELPNQHREAVRLSHLMGGWPTILVFSRGHY